MTTILTHRWTALAIRWILGLTFAAASIHKIAAPAEFAKIIYGYGLFPHISINLIAIVLPFVELVTGLSLLFNFRSKAAATLIGIMLIGFILAISVNMARGHTFECGCFSFGSKNPLTETKYLLVRDIFFLMLCITLLRINGRTTTEPTIDERPGA